MKICRLDLMAFGSLRDLSLELCGEAERPRLHVIYGPNEAGKSTALRALTGLFYGIPEQTKDAHSIEPSKLRIGAVLRDVRGRELGVVRRKGRKDTLLSAQGTPLPAAEYAWVHASTSERTFHALFGLSFDTLHRGADDLLSSGGDLGQSLFSAAVGGGRVRQLLDTLDKEADELFRPRGRVQHLNVALAQFDAAKKKSREESVKVDAITAQASEVELFEKRCAELAERMQALHKEREQLERARRVLPLIVKQRSLLEEKNALLAQGPHVALPESAPSLRRAAETLLHDAGLRLAHAREEIERLTQALAQHEEEAVSASLATLPASSIEGLRDRLSNQRRAVRELPRRQEAHTHARAEVERVLGRLSLPSLPAAEIEKLRMPKLLEARVREHVRLGGTLRGRVRELERAVAIKRDQRARAARKLWQLWGREPAVAAINGEGSVDLAAAVPQGIPSEASCREEDERLRELTDLRASVDSELRKLAVEAERNQRQREALALLGEPPTEADLAALRAERGAVLAELRTWLATDPSPRPVDSLNLVTLFERALELVDSADAVADRLRREAERVAQAAQLAAERDSLARMHARLNAERTQLTEHIAARERAWRSGFEAAGVSVRSPRDTVQLLTEQRAYLQQLELIERELSETQLDFEQHTAREQAWQSEWQSLAAELGVAESTTPAELEALFDARAELSTRHDAEQQLAQELRELERELAEFSAEAQRLCEQHMPELAELPSELAAERVIEAYKRTRTALAQVEQLRARQAEHQSAAERAQRDVERAESELERLVQAAGVTDRAELELAEQRSQRLQQLELELRGLTHELAAACDGLDPATVVAETALSLDEVRVRSSVLADELEDLDRQRMEANQQLTSKQLGIHLLHAKHAATDAASDALIHLDQARTLTERYVRVRFAASVLRREIARYREKHRAPVLRAAAELFAALTLGAYTGLDVDYGEHDEPVLVCVRKDGVNVGIAGLSTGTRDQLYLALRLASIRHLAEHSEPLPLILDDILVHFDDERARAALIALADFAQTTQVLFFTHHQRLCELAQAALHPERFQLHHLLRSPSAPANPSEKGEAPQLSLPQ